MCKAFLDIGEETGDTRGENKVESILTGCSGIEGDFVSILPVVEAVVPDQSLSYTVQSVH